MPYRSSSLRLARDRTDLAEDRTLLANQRTFSGWTRTSLAALGIGLGFEALYKTIEPPWIPKLIATIFIGLGIFTMLTATRHSTVIARHLTPHTLSQSQTLRLHIIAGVYCFGAVALALSVWALG